MEPVEPIHKACRAHPPMRRQIHASATVGGGPACVLSPKGPVLLRSAVSAAPRVCCHWMGRARRMWVATSPLRDGWRQRNSDGSHTKEELGSWGEGTRQ
jgi:hypothetical protein